MLRYPTSRQDFVHDWRRRLDARVGLPSGEIDTILVICHGNICRSPYVEARLAEALPDRRVSSAGLEAGDGDPAFSTALRVASERDLDLAAHRSRPMTDALVAEADLIVAMEGRHHAGVARRWPDALPKLVLIGHFLSGAPYTVPDPWGEPAAVFHATFDRLDEATEALAARLRGSGREPNPMAADDD